MIQTESEGGNPNTHGGRKLRWRSAKGHSSRIQKSSYEKPQAHIYACTQTKLKVYSSQAQKHLCKCDAFRLRNI